MPRPISSGPNPPTKPYNSTKTFCSTLLIVQHRGKIRITCTIHPVTMQGQWFLPAFHVDLIHQGEVSRPLNERNLSFAQGFNASETELVFACGHDARSCFHILPFCFCFLSPRLDLFTSGTRTKHFLPRLGPGRWRESGISRL